jgi:LysM repeat protein
MSNPNPIIPPGSPLQRPHPETNSKLLVSVILIVTVHACVLSGLLIQGCKRQDATNAGDVSTNQEPPFARLPPPVSGAAQEQAKMLLAPNVPSPQTNASVLPPRATELGSTPDFVATPPPMPNATPGAGASQPTLAAANPGANPAASSNPSVYVVKKGDTLTKVAKLHGTTLKALRAANNMQTDRLLVSQKLKIPAGDATETKSETGQPPPHSDPHP